MTPEKRATKWLAEYERHDDFALTVFAVAAVIREASTDALDKAMAVCDGARWATVNRAHNKALDIAKKRIEDLKSEGTT